MDFKYLFFSFDGRINRAKWWLGLLILVIAQWVVMLILGSVLGMSMTGSFDPNNPDAMAGQMMGMMIPMVVIGLLFLYPALAVYTKRWHDRNKSGWWTLI
ncbi:MAG TPA: DUF805 domain-containing protein, partial [Rhodobacteraceae bacterium]|nr:DUF805 domain-containing protein [Paracoccaceae bacterium]